MSSSSDWPSVSIGGVLSFLSTPFSDWFSVFIGGVGSSVSSGGLGVAFRSRFIVGTGIEAAAPVSVGCSFGGSGSALAGSDRVKDCKNTSNVPQNI